MPTGRMSDLKRLLPPGTTIWAGVVEVPQTYDRRNTEVQRKTNIWRVSVYAPDRVYHYDAGGFGKAVRLAISAICTSGWVDRLWSEYAKANPKAGVVTRESLCEQMTVTEFSQDETTAPYMPDSEPKKPGETIILKRKPEAAKVLVDQECYDCGAIIDPIYINCPVCGSYAVYDTQSELKVDETA